MTAAKWKICLRVETAKEKKSSQGMAVIRAKMVKESCDCQREKMLPWLLFSQDIRMTVNGRQLQIKVTQSVNDNYKSEYKHN